MDIEKGVIERLEKSAKADADQLARLVGLMLADKTRRTDDAPARWVESIGGGRIKGDGWPSTARHEPGASFAAGVRRPRRQGILP